MEAGIVFKMTNVLDCACPQIVYYQHVVAALQVSFGKVRPDETRTASYQYAQIVAPLINNMALFRRTRGNSSLFA